MKCEDMLRMLNDYVDGDVDISVCKEFEKHLTGCDPCKVVVDTIRKTITLYKGSEVYEVPAEFHTRLYETLRRKWDETKKAD